MRRWRRRYHPNWIAGISIGAINAAIIAGNPSNSRVDRSREFGPGDVDRTLGLVEAIDSSIGPETMNCTRSLLNQMSA